MKHSSLWSSWRSNRANTAVGLFGLVLVLSGCTRKQPALEEPAPEVAGDTVILGTNSPQLAALTIEAVGANQRTVLPLGGRLTWDEEATVRVFTPFSGIVRKLFVEVNQPVAKGAPLAEIQSADFEQALADARKAASEFRRAERNLARLRDLFEHGAAPRKDWEAAEADYASAEAEKERTETRLAIYGASSAGQGHAFRLPSPLEGILVEKTVTPGQEVRPDQMLANLPQVTAPLFVVTDPSRLWIQIDATEADLPYLRQGCEFMFSSRAFPGQTFTGRVEVVSEFIDSSTRTIKVRGTVDNSSRLLKAEMFVSVNLPGQELPGASIPSRAVFLKGKKHYVFLADEPGRFARQEVEIGGEQDGQILVLAGLQPGQRIVTDGCVLLAQALK